MLCLKKGLKKEGLSFLCLKKENRQTKDQKPLQPQNIHLSNVYNSNLLNKLHIYNHPQHFERYNFNEKVITETSFDPIDNVNGQSEENSKLILTPKLFFNFEHHNLEIF